MASYTKIPVCHLLWQHRLILNMSGKRPVTRFTGDHFVPRFHFRFDYVGVAFCTIGRPSISNREFLVFLQDLCSIPAIFAEGFRYE
ncbi:MAG TPA: hypothetical protein VKE92_10380, partial [Anaerolineales bacterium]|nr:hypothetical protein [Anaerolineales bacterium]